VLLCFVALMAIRIAADLSFNMDEFAEHRKGDTERTVTGVVSNIGSYYGYRSLLYFRELGAVIIVVAATFTLAKMNHTNELTAILASGVSLHRVLLPIVLCAIGLNALVVIDSELIIPRFKEPLTRSRDDPEMKDTLKIRTVVDDHNSCWYSAKFLPETSKVRRPIIMLRDERYADRGRIAGAWARHDAARREWVLEPAPLDKGGPVMQARLHLPGAGAAAKTDYITTLLDPAAMVRQASGKARARRINVDWSKVSAIRDVDVSRPQAGAVLTIKGKRLPLTMVDGQVVAATLERPRFIFRGADGAPMAEFRAETATFVRRGSPREWGWQLTGGQLVYTCDLTPSSLRLRQSGDWMELMSTTEMGRLLRLRRVGDAERGRMLRHGRFADFFGSIILLLVGVPFVLSRERDIKASAGVTVAVVGGVWVFMQFARHLELPAMLAAWVPIIICGVIAAFVVEAVKT